MRRRAALDALAEQDGHAVLRLDDGTILEGWILEVDDDGVVFEHAPSPFYAQATGTSAMAPPTRTIPAGSIAAYMDEARRWRNLPED